MKNNKHQRNIMVVMLRILFPFQINIMNELKEMRKKFSSLTRSFAFKRNVVNVNSPEDKIGLRVREMARTCTRNSGRERAVSPKAGIGRRGNLSLNKKLFLTMLGGSNYGIPAAAAVVSA